ncbi:chemotaxis protein CheR [Fischerella muscicola CCMEE 5323]|uniref:protein-glutamate O-methyltransferase n=1 Tax=Fischerella muscicola CCMEE 5323 TaxID=2019572 RepID=A0A2N6JX85_FISMU|nr:CheR family methyltransferase [Fischerella muscicola]PLZ84920.1 chemotaxis protein CheR [Fischerella muscicola CCMEE 5323]
MSVSDDNPDFEALLNYLKQNCGYDLTLYKRASLMRRFQRRMQQLRIDNYPNYLQYFQGHPEECTSLLDTILINFSGFFRDRDCWEYLANNIIPQILTNKQPQEKIRVWSAGCAYGQEVYTLVMLLVERLGIEQYLQRVQIFATDVDEDALKQARQASYTEHEVIGIPNELLSKYFEKTEQRYVFLSKLRSTIIFGRHDLAIDAPMSKIDLLVCRNVLIYFNAQTQATVLVRFHFALTDKGFLFLGSAESMTSNKHVFIPVSLKHRIYAKGQNLTIDDHLLIRPQTRNKKALDPLATQIRIWQTAFESSPFPQLVVDRNGCLMMTNKQASILFNLQSSHLEAPVRDLEIGQIVNFLTLMRQLHRDRRPLTLKNVEWKSDYGTNCLDIHITPISDPNHTLIAANLTFIDVTRYTGIKDELESSNFKLASLTQELQLTKDTLNTTYQELESTQKELETVHQEIQLLRQGFHNN